MRETRVLQVAASMPGERDASDPLAANERAFLSVLESAERFDPDFVSFQELVLVDGVDRDAQPIAELTHRFPGPFLDRVGERARALDSYVWVPTYERDGEDVYNAVALVGPDGDLEGTYRKVAPTIDEIENRGITPGTELPVWDTEFGRVAASICWDVRFDDVALGYRGRGVDLLFHPTLGLGQGKLAHWATYHGYHVAYCWKNDTRIFTPAGNTVGRVTGHPTMPSVDLEGDASVRFGPATVNTDVRSYAMGRFTYGDSELSDAQRAYPDALEVHTCHEEGVVVLESTDEGVSIEQVEAEFDLTTTEAAERRGRELVAGAVENSPLLGPETFRPGASAHRSAPGDDD